MRPMLRRLPWQPFSSSTCTCRAMETGRQPRRPRPPPSSGGRVRPFYLRRCVRVGSRISAQRRHAEAPAGLLPLPPLLHLLQLRLLVAVLQVLHEHRHHHVDQHELGRQHERDEVHRGDDGQVAETVAVLRPAVSQRVLGARERGLREKNSFYGKVRARGVTPMLMWSDVLCVTDSGRCRHSGCEGKLML